MKSATRDYAKFDDFMARLALVSVSFGTSRDVGALFYRVLPNAAVEQKPLGGPDSGTKNAAAMSWRFALHPIRSLPVECRAGCCPFWPR
jgi:hypothetical protein